MSKKKTLKQFDARKYIASHKKGVIGVSAACLVLALIIAMGGSRNPEFTGAEVVTERTIVQKLQFRGRVEAQKDSSLSFSRSGIITSIKVQEGDMVEQGQVLVTLDTSELSASRMRALGEVSSAQAQYQKVVQGDRQEDKLIQGQASATANLNVEQTTAKYDKLIADARTTLFSSDLEAMPENLSYNQTRPTVSGTYLSQIEGQYKIFVYPSSAGSGVSLEYSGMEHGAAEIAFGIPIKLGTRGLYLTFPSGNNYANTKWVIDIPNKKGASYARNLSTYNQTVSDKDIAVADARLRAATEDLKNQSIANGARPEDVAISRASLQVAQSNLAQVNSQIESSVMRAPFDGVIANLNYKIGEFASSTQSGLRLVADGGYVVNIQVPETDIFFITEDQQVDITYEALAGTTYTGSISHVELADSVVDGTRVYEVTARLDPIEGVTLRPGLTASVYVPVSIPRVLTLSKEAVHYDEKKNMNIVYKKEGDEIVAVPVTIGRVSDDGFVEIRTGVSERDTVYIPEVSS